MDQLLERIQISAVLFVHGGDQGSDRDHTAWKTWAMRKKFNLIGKT